MTNRLLCSGPLIVFWNITCRCNLYCQHCHVGNDQYDDLNTEQCLDIVNNLRAAKVKMVILSGGEPLLRQDIFDIVRPLRDDDIKVSIATNGYTIDQNILTKLKSLNINEVQISLDSSEQRVHDAFRGKAGSYQKAIDAIRLCHEMSIPVGVNTVITPHNINGLWAMGEQLQSMGVKCWRLTINVPKGRGAALSKELQVHDNDLINIIPKLSSTYKNISIDDPLCVRFWRINSRIAKQCGAGIILCAIEPDGTVKPCVFSDSYLGNILENPLFDIWNSMQMEVFRNSNAQLSDCKECSEYSKCKGGCKAFNSYYRNNKITQKCCF